MSLLQGKNAFVTGGATGIGLAITRSLVDAGAQVTIASRDKDRSDEIAAGLSAVKALVLDVSDPDSVSATFAEAGPIDILVNNAGIAKSSPFDRTSLELWSSILAVNLTGVFLCSQAALTTMRDQRSGRIINIASTAGLKGYPYIGAYCAAKHGVVGMSRSLALELAGTNITVNSVCPGFTDTAIADDAIANITNKTGRNADEALAEIVKSNPQSRLIQTDEVANVVLWLCQPESRSITGQSIAVAGGEIT